MKNGNDRGVLEGGNWEEVHQKEKYLIFCLEKGKKRENGVYCTILSSVQ